MGLFFRPAVFVLSPIKNQKKEKQQKTKNSHSIQWDSIWALFGSNGTYLVSTWIQFGSLWIQFELHVDFVRITLDSMWILFGSYWICFLDYIWTEIKRGWKKKKENPNRIRWNPMVGQWSTIGWPLLGLWLAKGWPMVGQRFADGWVRAKFNVFFRSDWAFKGFSIKPKVPRNIMTTLPIPESKKLPQSIRKWNPELVQNRIQNHIAKGCNFGDTSHKKPLKPWFLCRWENVAFWVKVWWYLGACFDIFYAGGKIQAWWGLDCPWDGIWTGFRLFGQFSRIQSWNFWKRGSATTRTSL